MIATHSAKAFNSRYRQSAVCADLPTSIPSEFICSKNVTGRRYWALPRNAAEMSKFRELAEWFATVNNYMPSMSGYGFLHEPAIVEKTRVSGYRHAFVEPVFSMMCQGSFTDDCWFSRYEHNWGVSWGKLK